MDAAVTAQEQETDGLARQAQRHFPELPVSARQRGDRQDQSDPEGLGAILCRRELECLFFLPPRLGRKEDPASSGPSVPASRLRLEAVEQGMAIWNAGALRGVPRQLCPAELSSRPGRIRLI